MNLKRYLLTIGLIFSVASIPLQASPAFTRNELVAILGVIGYMVGIIGSIGLETEDDDPEAIGLAIGAVGVAGGLSVLADCSGNRNLNLSLGALSFFAGIAAGRFTYKQCS